MEAGYVFMNVQPGRKKEVLEKIKNVKGVREAHVVLGVFDIIVRIEAETIDEIERIYFNEIEKIDGVVSARLHLVARERTIK